MKIAITGATGFIGRHLCSVLRHDSHRLVLLGRQELARTIPEIAELLADCEVVINLAGESINSRWTPARKHKIMASRLDTTRKLVDAMGMLEPKPGLFISTSGIGAFDAQGHYDEHDPPNARDFLGRLSRCWENIAHEAEEEGIRTVIFRFGLVLGHDGGMMKKLLLPFRLGLGGTLGDGQQPFSWVHINDLLRAYRHLLSNPAMRGVYHLCAPQPSTNKEFTRLLGEVLHRPTLLPVPLWLLRLIYGEGVEAIASGQSVVSVRLPEDGFHFRYPQLRHALEAVVHDYRRRR